MIVGNWNIVVNEIIGELLERRRRHFAIWKLSAI